MQKFQVRQRRWDAAERDAAEWDAAERDAAERDATDERRVPSFGFSISTFESFLIHTEIGGQS